MALAALGAIAIGNFEEAAMLILIFAGAYEAAHENAGNCWDYAKTVTAMVP